MELIPDTGLILDAIPARRADAIEAAHGYLVGQGADPLEADEALARARVSRTWYSPTRGLTHDCKIHRPEEATAATCDPNAREVGLVAGISITAKR